MKPQGSGHDRERFQALLTGLLRGGSLDRVRARYFFDMLFRGKIPFRNAKAFLLLLARKGESAEEILGCLQALRRLERPIGPKVPGLMDTCGTGGDGRQTINISTLAALVMAGAGAKIAKHGNRAVSSRSGSSDLMEACGVRLDCGFRKNLRAIRRCGIGYFHAPFYHPVFARMQPLRKALKRRTILNELGPLANPMRLDHQLVGVSRARLVPLYAAVLSGLSRKTAFVCHSRDGMDEVSTSEPTSGVWITRGRLRREIIRPGAYGLRKATLKDLRARSVREGLIRARKILRNRDRGPARDVILLNAAVGLVVCGRAASVGEGVRLARRSLETGAAWSALRQLRDISR
ncbi:MAG: anthranilate phosphoribosyltransferase [Candidatus Omnitrophica bacterium]|nr:anthranilate phosphoribosyltransferase [Candidatus Omnitrophota bacterium]